MPRGVYTRNKSNPASNGAPHVEPDPVLVEDFPVIDENTDAPPQPGYVEAYL